jgi:hypothetical protein
MHIVILLLSILFYHCCVQWLEHCDIVAVHIVIFFHVVQLLCTLSYRYYAHCHAVSEQTPILLLYTLFYHYCVHWLERCDIVTVHMVIFLLCTTVVQLLCTLSCRCYAHCHAVTVHTMILLQRTLLYRHRTQRPILSWTLWYCCCAHWILKYKRTIFQVLNL